MTIKRLGVERRLSNVVIHGNTVYLAGQIAEEAAGKSVTEQTRDILNQIDEALAEAGTDKTKILQVTIWLSKMAYFGEMNAVWDAWVPEGHTPARACVEARLADPKIDVEIMLTAAL
ncbi:RidA family protein [Rhodoligotrophos defluvii]|uniref:RidA family protein n=1 Tax=Rhodoligotrophos defluvii TaxID=2561934 RepID=UPI0010C9DDD5|nr:RidA family protein [Rhodoligotrophos defluvii]